jgi:hypothetical protein
MPPKPAASKVKLPHPLSGAYEKLQRADESIQNLYAEITRFFEESKYPIIDNSDDKLFLEAIDYHGKREIPIRFSVLAGEIIHHLRSSLDHVAWQLSSETYRRTHTHAIEFPVFDTEPIKKDDISKYERKIKGITSPSARKIIKDIQPYQTADPLDDLLWIVHDMDRIDKHRELTFVFPSFSVLLPPELAQYALLDASGKLLPMSAEIANSIKKQSKVTPQIAFGEFGKRKGKFVVIGLFQLTNFIRDTVKLFAGEFPWLP